MDAVELPSIDFTSVDASAPGTGRWDAVRAQVMDALATFGCFDAHYPTLAPAHRAALFDGAVRPLFALPADVKRRNTYGPGKPFHGYLGELPGLEAYESLAIVDGHRPEEIQAFAELMFPGADNAAFCETVHGAAAQMAELEGTVRRMVMEGLGVHGEAQSEPMWHLFRVSEYGAPTADEKEREVRYGSHQDTNSLSLVCQHEVDGLEMQARDGRWILVRPSPASLVVMAGNALRAWSNDRVHAPFHRISVGGEATRYSAMLFSVPGGSMIRAPDELVDEAGGHPRRFRDYDYDEFIRFCVSEEGGRHEDKLKAYCGV
ncbi:probable 2-oxoglutarate-dependent dioxygenase AOP1 [Lolium rigidum]|uniref:probable 2-oxoglutarate-dependent dioxygenase AOP1 n=1 Tax=Lolium rigidum TaxID=89674 RepID=UPI001F5C3D52|nr:probable 2-oxoglutarate-dependent dioxygenase AOP1 [Lolium rigidum]